MYVLGLDVGTSAVKAAVLDQQSGTPLSHPVKVPYSLDHPVPDAAEIPPDRLKDATWQAAQQAVSEDPSGLKIEGVGLSCLMPALVLLDRVHRPVTPIWIHLDRRSRPMARKVIVDRLADEFLATCGNSPLPGGMSALCYAQQLSDRPSLRSELAHYLHVNGWLGLLLTGERYFDYANASFTGLFGTLTDQNWSSRWCDYFQVDPKWLPPVVCGSTTIGSLVPSVASEWGLASGIPVKIGTADTSSGMLTARMQPDDLYVTVGTTTVLARFVDDPKPNPKRLTRMFGIGKKHIYAAHNPVGGSALPWILELCFQDYQSTDRVDEFYSKLIPEAAKRSTEVVLDPPFLGGDRLQIESRKAAFRELNLATDRLDLLVALLVSMRDGHRAAFAVLEWGKKPIDRIFLTGGGTEVLRTILPELADAKIELIEDGALKGTARLFDVQ